LDEAMRLFKSNPDPVSVSLLIRKQNSLATARLLLNTLINSQSKHGPNSHIFRELFMLCRRERSKDAIELWKWMRELRVLPKPQVFNAFATAVGEAYQHGSDSNTHLKAVESILVAYKELKSAIVTATSSKQQQQSTMPLEVYLSFVSACRKLGSPTTAIELWSDFVAVALIIAPTDEVTEVTGVKVLGSFVAAMNEAKAMNEANKVVSFLATLPQLRHHWVRYNNHI